MTGPKLLDALRDFFDEKKKKQRKNIDDLLKIISKLEHYQKKLEQELNDETKKRKIEEIKAELEVVKRKCSKAHKLLKSL